MEFKRYVTISSGIILIFPIVLFVLAAIAWAENIYAGIFYLLVGGAQFVGMALIYPGIAKLDDVAEIGNKCVQHNWIVLAFGVSGCMMFLAPFLLVDPTAISHAAFTVSLLSVLLAIFSIYKAMRDARARLIV